VNRFRTQQGAALVITLIMLGMVTAMTVVFLGISQRERASVTVVSDQVSAKRNKFVNIGAVPKVAGSNKCYLVSDAATPILLIK